MNAMSMRARILLANGVLIFVITALLVLVAINALVTNNQKFNQNAQELLFDNAAQRISVQGNQLAKQISQEFEASYQQLSGLARNTVIVNDNTGQVGYYSNIRKIVQSLLSGGLLNNPQATGIYSIWLPNAVDEDEVFEEDPEYGSNAQGRFSSYWHKGVDGEPVNRIVEEPQLAASPQDWYQCSIEQGRPCVLEPFWQTSDQARIWTSRVTTPLLYQGEVRGMYGMDLALTALQARAGVYNQDLFEGKGRLSIVSAQQQLVASTDSALTPGQAIPNIPQKVAAQFADAKQALILDAEAGHYWGIVPVVLVEQTAPWFIVYDLPQSALLADAILLQQTLETSLQQTLWLQLVIAAIALGVALAVIYYLARSTIRPVERITRALQRVAEGDGDLSQRLPEQGGREVSRLAQAFNRFQGQLASMIQQISELATALEAQAQHSRSSSDATQAAITQQQDELTHITSAMRELLSSTNSVAENVGHAASEAQQAESLAATCRSTFAEADNQVQQLNSTVNDVAGVMSALQQQSQKIAGIVDVISGIAEQTNLLALNAAIESARAGEHGRGFAVVADEVRQLAQRTSQSTEEIRQVIDSLLKESNQAAQYTRQSHDNAAASIQAAQQADDALQHINHAIIEMSAMNQQIASTAEEQASVSHQVADSIGQLESVSQSVLADSVNGTQASSEMEALAQRLKAHVGQFKF